MFRNKIRTSVLSHVYYSVFHRSEIRITWWLFFRKLSIEFLLSLWQRIFNTTYDIYVQMTIRQRTLLSRLYFSPFHMYNKTQNPLKFCWDYLLENNFCAHETCLLLRTNYYTHTLVKYYTSRCVFNCHPLFHILALENRFFYKDFTEHAFLEVPKIQLHY